MAVDRPVELSLDTFLMSLSKAGYAEPHNVFSGTARYVPAAAELGELGLLRRGELDEEFEHTLGVLSLADAEYFAHVRAGDLQGGVLVAAREHDIVTAVSEGDRVLLRPAQEREPTRELAMCLPEFPTASFRPFSVRRTELTDGGDDGDAVDIFDDGPSSSGRDSRELRAMLDPPFHGTGYLHVARRTPDGRRVQADQAVTYVDRDAGRVCFDITGPPNNQHITALPGDTASLAERIGRLRRTLE